MSIKKSKTPEGEAYSKQSEVFSVIEGRRFDLRPLNESDIFWIIRMFTNPVIMKNSYDGKPLSTLQAIKKYQVYKSHWAEHGFGFWMMLAKDSGDRIGCCGFRYVEDRYHDFQGRVEVGFMLAPRYWGQGYASEAVKICLQAGFTVYRFAEILATTSLKNIASQRLLTRAGFKEYPETHIYGSIQKVFAVDFAQYCQMPNQGAA